MKTGAGTMEIIVAVPPQVRNRFITLTNHLHHFWPHIQSSVFLYRDMCSSVFKATLSAIYRKQKQSKLLNVAHLHYGILLICKEKSNYEIFRWMDGTGMNEIAQTQKDNCHIFLLIREW